MKKQDVFKSIGIIFLMLAMIIILMLCYAYFLKTQLRDEIITTLSEISAQSVKTVTAEIDIHFTLMEEIASTLVSQHDGFNPESAMEILKTKKVYYRFKRMGLALPNGTTMFADGNTSDSSGRDYIKRAFEGTTSVSDKIKDRFDNTDVISYATPVVENGAVKAVLFAAIDTDRIMDLLAVRSFNGYGYSYIVKVNGDGVIDSKHPESFDLANIFDNMIKAEESNQKSIDIMKRDMQEGKTGCVTFVNKIKKYMYYMPTGQNDWYLVHVVPEYVLTARVGNIMQKTYIVCAAISVVLVVVACYWYYYARKRNSQLNEILYKDPVTGGSSQAKFLIDSAESLRTTDKPAAILSLDLNNFKLVNEIFGRDTGDVLLWFVHSAMSKVLPRGSYYARGMADRFYALMYYSSNDQLVDTVKTLAEYIVKKAPERFETFILKPSIGIYIVKNRRKNVQEMLNSASFAKNSIKHELDRRYAFYTDAHRSSLLENKQLSDEMEVALKNNEFEPYFQPQYRTSDRQICGAEALMRWRKKDGTIVQPSKFIPLAEKNGFISQLDENMFVMVCKHQRQLLDSGIEPVPVSVNMSRQLLYDSMFIEKYIGVMEQYNLPVKYIELEITETALFENQDKFLEIINRLHDYGFKILMDDFGTGYSSLMMLKSIPIDIMKLDKTFIDDYDDEAGLHIIKCVINLAKSLNIAVIAEGVEQEQQYKLLSALECDVIQGFYFSRPVQFKEFKKMLQNRTFRDGI